MLLGATPKSLLLTNTKPQATTSLTASSFKANADMHLNIFIESCTSEMALFTLSKNTYIYGQSLMMKKKGMLHYADDYQQFVSYILLVSAVCGNYTLLVVQCLIKVTLKSAILE